LKIDVAARQHTQHGRSADMTNLDIRQAFMDPALVVGKRCRRFFRYKIRQDEMELLHPFRV